MKTCLPELLTRQELATILKLTPRGVESMTRRRIIPVVKLAGRTVRYNPEAVQRALENLTVDALSDKPGKKLAGRVVA